MDDSMTTMWFHVEGRVARRRARGIMTGEGRRDGTSQRESLLPAGETYEDEAGVWKLQRSVSLS